MKVLLKLDGRTESGGAPMLMHCDRLADPLDEYARAISAISGKRKKTEEELLEISRLEFLGGLYLNGNGPCIPANNIHRCLRDGATKHKRGKDVPRGVWPIDIHADLQYDGPRDPEELWKSQEFALRKPVGINSKRVVRTRPVFVDWQAQLTVEVDPVIFDLHHLKVFWEDAGKYYGIGDMRPYYGKFHGTLEEVQ